MSTIAALLDYAPKKSFDPKWNTTETEKQRINRNLSKITLKETFVCTYIIKGQECDRTKLTKNWNWSRNSENETEILKNTETEIRKTKVETETETEHAV